MQSFKYYLSLKQYLIGRKPLNTMRKKGTSNPDRRTGTKKK